MMFNVPQFIDVEDKIVGPFTGRQLLWMFGLGATLLVLWNLLEKSYFIIAAIILSLIFIAFAFYRPYNQPLIKFVIYAILFLFRPKSYFWERNAQAKKNIKPTKDKTLVTNAEKKFIMPEELTLLAKTLDSSKIKKGENRNKP